jgi:methylmalonyl-CoA mutase
MTTFSEWRAQVEKDLAGVAFDKALVTKTVEGLSVQPLYAEAPKLVVPGMPTQFSLALRQRGEGRGEGPIEAQWSKSPVAEADFQILDGSDLPSPAAHFALNHDPLAPDFVVTAKKLDAGYPHGLAALISTLRFHDDGADAADELAITLSTAVVALETLLQAGFTAPRAIRQLGVQIAVGRDTFGELSKLRALRILWDKLATASGAPNSTLFVHAVCSSRTLTQRDPWVNMLRGTTQTFAAILGGANVITPTSFDQELGEPSALGQRVAMNTGLVLRHESFLGQVVDPSGGSYYLDTFTDALAREAWKRFQEIEATGGLQQAMPKVKARIAATWEQRLEAIAKRKTPILGVSEFANVDEQLPTAPRLFQGPGHRDAEAFEQLRLIADKKRPSALLLTLGTLAESRARVGFAANYFGAGGIKTRETTMPERAVIACLCGTDERYATEAASRARALKAAGCERVLVAGRPGANEAELRAAGVDGFIFMGADLIATLNELLDVYP